MDMNVLHMRSALRMARQAAEAGEVPVGAVIVHDGRVIGRACNQVELLKDPTAHAEILAITQAASALGDWRLLDTTLYVTKQPCPMCAGAIIHARIPTLFWGLPNPPGENELSRSILDNPHLNHRVTCEAGLLEAECREVLQGFFKTRRKRPRESRGDPFLPGD